MRQVLLLTQSRHREDEAVNRAGDVFYRNGIELPLTLELLEIFLLPTLADSVVQTMRGGGE